MGEARLDLYAIEALVKAKGGTYSEISRALRACVDEIRRLRTEAGPDRLHGAQIGDRVVAWFRLPLPMDLFTDVMMRFAQEYPTAVPGSEEDGQVFTIVVPARPAEQG